jgi:hypothetical protein
MYTKIQASMSPQLERELLGQAFQPATFEFVDQAGHGRTL